MFGRVTHRVVGLLRAGFVASCRHTPVGVPVTQATAFHNQIVDGVMLRGERGGARLLGLTRTRLTLQQTDPQVGDHQLVLGSRTEGIHLVRGRQSSVDHLETGEESESRASDSRGGGNLRQTPRSC